MEPIAAKAALRRTMLDKRQALPPAVKLRAAQSVRLHFADHPHLTYATSFAGYYPIRGEVDVLPVFNHMRRFHKAMGLPRIGEGGALSFRRWQPGEALEDGLHAIKAPPAEAPAFVPEVVLVPLLAFDDRGFRLGYGGGYYDRAMAVLRASEAAPPLFIGVAYAMQEAAALPVEPHDARLDGILTEEGVSLFGS